jgi:hypothetical protein
VNERSDFGIMAPDGRPRPSARLLAAYAPRLKHPRPWPAADLFFTMDRDAHAGGYWRVCFHEGKDAYRRAREQGKNLGIRTRGTGTTSVDTPLIAVGNRPGNGRNPPKYLNAEFNVFEILDVDGKWVEATSGAVIEVAAGAPVRARVSVGNTREATWIPAGETGGRPGGVVLASTPASGIRIRRPIPGVVPYLADADLGEFVLTEAVDKTVAAAVRMRAEGRCAFGEIRRFTLKPQTRK